MEPHHVSENEREPLPQELGEKATPLSELDFWSSRAADLTSMAAQLNGPVITAVSISLRAACSTYASPLDRYALNASRMGMQSRESSEVCLSAYSTQGLRAR